MCLEKRAFYRAVSGLHASINIHLCAKYLLSAPGSLEVVSTSAQWGPNLEELVKRFSPEKTGNEGPNWLKNLYFIYLLELRALDKASPYLEKEQYYTGNESEDVDTRMAIRDILNIVRYVPELRANSNSCANFFLSTLENIWPSQSRSLDSELS